MVLRTRPFGEADRVITFLGKNFGKFQALAKGIRKTNSSFGARLEPFMVADVMIHRGKSLDIVTQAVMVERFGLDIAHDYEAFTAASAMCEIAEKLTGNESELLQFDLLFRAVKSLSMKTHLSQQTLDSFVLRSMSVAGWEPSFQQCIQCGESESDLFFHVESGGCFCRQCFLTGSITVSLELRTLLSALLHGTWPVVDASSTVVKNQASAIISAFAQWHIETGVASFSHLNIEDQSVLWT